MSLNSVTISGYLGADSDLRAGQSGVSVLRFSLAVNERKKQSDGNYVDVPHWIDCVMFGNRAVGLQPYLRKGSKLSLLGHLSTSNYEKDGRTIKSMSVIVDQVELQNSKGNNQQQAAQSQHSQQAPAQDYSYATSVSPSADGTGKYSQIAYPGSYQAPQPAPAAEYSDAYADDDIPF